MKIYGPKDLKFNLSNLIGKKVRGSLYEDNILNGSYIEGILYLIVYHDLITPFSIDSDGIRLRVSYIEVIDD